MTKKYWNFCTYETGLSTVFKDYQEIVMRYLWGLGEEGAGSSKCWIQANEVLKEKEKTISRASVIFFLNEMVETGVVDYRDGTGKGGHHKIYFSVFDETGFKEHLATKVMERLASEYPEETRKVIRKFRQKREWKR